MEGETAKKLTTRDNAVISYRILRGKEPRRLLVLLHGMASNLTRWSEFVETTVLRDSWDLLRLDLRGHAGSLWRGPVSMEIWCDDLAEVLDAEGYDDAIVAGHCLGANLALNFASRHPLRTAGLVLVEPMPRQSLTGTLRKFQPIKPLVFIAIRIIRLLNGLGLQRKSIPVLDLHALDRETRAAVAEQGSPDAMLRRYAVPWHDLRFMPSANYLQEFLEVSRPLPRLSGITVPVLALLSSGTFLNDPERTRRVLYALPDLEVLLLDAHHWIPTERPKEMREAIEQWCLAL